MSERRHDFYVGGQRVASNVPATFLPHVAAEHTELSADEAARAIGLIDLAGLVGSLAQFAVNDMRDVETGETTLERLRAHYAEEHNTPDRDPDDGETTFDLWLQTPPEGRRDAVLAVAWQARGVELPEVDLKGYGTALMIQDLAREFTPAVETLTGGFLPPMPGAPLNHSAALFVIGYVSDRDEDPMDTLTTYLVLTWAAVRASRVKDGPTAPTS